MLKIAKVKRIFDVRLNNISQLSGFAKKNDLQYFLRNLCDIEYVTLPELAPDGKMLKQYRNKEISWSQYEQQYIELLDRRNVSRLLKKHDFLGACLLCSEHKPEFCHRRLALEHLNSQWPTQVPVNHLF